MTQKSFTTFQDQSEEVYVLCVCARAGEGGTIRCQVQPKRTLDLVIKGSYEQDSQHSCGEQGGWINCWLRGQICLSQQAKKH